MGNKPLAKINLLPTVVGDLADLYARSLHDTESTAIPGKQIPDPPAHDIDRTITDTFVRLDDEIISKPLDRVFATPSREMAARLLAPAYAGSSLTGDSRAVLGRRTTDANGQVTYEVHVLSKEQNGDNESEVARLAAEHPDETGLTKDGRVMGWGMCRAFGDAPMKWPLDVQARLKAEYIGQTPYRNVLTPPYFTAEPVITTTPIQPGDFLILATDGLWESLTSSEAVGLVGRWLEKSKSSDEPKSGPAQSAYGPEQLPVALEKDDTVRYRQWNATKRFAGGDSNAATHLIRSALGGADNDLTAALLAINSPRSRRYRDDITAVVVFFDDSS
ncbi:phosphatase 2C-like domain-containing protein [Melanogaster broomeanus]|nr:phosphatase 2C-like domain-containing protein [Melanogaster broomeanus]